MSTCHSQRSQRVLFITDAYNVPFIACIFPPYCTLVLLAPDLFPDLNCICIFKGNVWYILAMITSWFFLCSVFEHKSIWSFVPQFSMFTAISCMQLSASHFLIFFMWQTRSDLFCKKSPQRFEDKKMPFCLKNRKTLKFVIFSFYFWTFIFFHFS